MGTKKAVFQELSTQPVTAGAALSQGAEHPARCTAGAALCSLSYSNLEHYREVIPGSQTHLEYLETELIWLSITSTHNYNLEVELNLLIN